MKTKTYFNLFLYFETMKIKNQTFLSFYYHYYQHYHLLHYFSPFSGPNNKKLYKLTDKDKIKLTIASISYRKYKLTDKYKIILIVADVS